MSARGRRQSRRGGGAGEAMRRLHSWLELVQTSGPFLTLPVVARVFRRPPAVPAPHAGAVRGGGGHAGGHRIRHQVVELMLRRSRRASALLSTTSRPPWPNRSWSTA